MTRQNYFIIQGEEIENNHWDYRFVYVVYVVISKRRQFAK